jgi:hypothetical protein
MAPSQLWMAAAMHDDGTLCVESLDSSHLLPAAIDIHCLFAHVLAHFSISALELNGFTDAKMGSLVAGLAARCQLISLRAFCAPCSATLRHACAHSAPRWQLATQRLLHPAQAPGKTCGQLHSITWRCQATLAGPPGEDLSVNAIKRRQQELQGRIQDAVKVLMTM